jgi:hypothetical protein
MIPLSITSSDLTRLAKTSAAVATLAAFSVVFLRWDSFHSSPLSVLLSAFSFALAAPTGVILAASKLKWKYRWLSKLMSRRMVHGLWWGELRSDYVKTPGDPSLPPIPIAFVIKQTYLTLSIRSYTAALPGASVLESLHGQTRSDDANLRYAFGMTRWANAEKKATLGYGDLVLGGGDRELRGDYWTNSPSTGSIRLALLTRDCDEIHSFEDAQRVKSRLKTHAAAG